jgi:hypothetical protein
MGVSGLPEKRLGMLQMLLNGSFVTSKTNVQLHANEQKLAVENSLIYCFEQAS